MSLWWARREQLDASQLKLIEDLPLNGNHLVLGPPGSGKTNVLLRRAQFVRYQDMPNVMVLTFTRALTEFLKTGCVDSEGREIFPRSCISTIESWIRSIYEQHGADLPDQQNDLVEWKRNLANGAMKFKPGDFIPLYDAFFVDEAQDLLLEEIELARRWARVLFFVGDDRQRIYSTSNGLKDIRQVVRPTEEILPFHYRLAPELCKMADRILSSAGGDTLEARSHYSGPRPGNIEVVGPLSRDQQLQRCAERLRDQVRVYADLIRQGDRLGVVVARKRDRDAVLDFLENDDALQGLAKIIRARDGSDDEYDPAFDPDCPICILTLQGCKGLEFRALHWLFCEELSGFHSAEHYYTLITRAKTSLDISFTERLPLEIARSYAPPGGALW